MRSLVLPSPSFAAPCRRDAFTLVETVLALGIVVFSLVTMLAVVPVGLTTVRQAMDTTVQAQINQTIAAKALVLPFDQSTAALRNGTVPWEFYFDQEGFEQTARTDTTRFVVTVTGSDARYPGSTEPTATDLNQSIVTLKLHTTLQQGGATVADTALNVSNQSGTTPTLP